jgi:cyanate lyase
VIVCRAEAEALILSLKKQIENLQPQELLQQLEKQKLLLQTQRDESKQLELLLSNEQQRLHEVEEERNTLLLTLQETASTSADLSVGVTNVFHYVSLHAGAAAFEQKLSLSEDEVASLQQPQRRESHSSVDPPHLPRSLDKTLKRASVSLNSLLYHATTYSFTPDAVELALRRSEQVEERLQFAQRQIQKLQDQTQKQQQQQQQQQTEVQLVKVICCSLHRCLWLSWFLRNPCCCSVHYFA